MLVIEYCGEIITKKVADVLGKEYDKTSTNYLFDLNKFVDILKTPKSKLPKFQTKKNEHIRHINADGVKVKYVIKNT